MKISMILSDREFLNRVDAIKSNDTLSRYDKMMQLYSCIKGEFPHFYEGEPENKVAKIFRSLANTYFGLDTENGKTAWLAYREFTGVIPPRKEKKVEKKPIEKPIEKPITEEKKKVVKKTTTDDGVIRHKDFDEIVAFINAGGNPYLFGSAGTGKSELAVQVAKAMGLEFYMETAIQDIFALKGFIDANGNYQETEFYKAFTKGGIFLWDEIDASSPEVGVAINTALAQKRFTFPNGQVTAHKDFHIIGAGNTIGKGADSEYTGRVKMDVSTLNRFLPYKVDYDERIELKIANNDKEFVEFIHSVRECVKVSNMEHIISYRNISAYMMYYNLFGDMEKALSKAILGTLDVDDVNAIKVYVSSLKKNKYATALQNVKSIFEQ